MGLKVYGVIGLGLLGFFTYDQYNKRVNYQAVNARVSSVSEQCYMEKTERGVLSRTTHTSDLLNCDIADQLTRIHPAWQGYDVRHKIEVRFAFISAVDGATHTSSLQMSTYPNGKPLRAGDVFAVRASKTEADRARAI